MRIEAALFVPYGGQHRFAIDTKIVASDASQDYKFADRCTKRSAPTFSELIDSPRLSRYEQDIQHAVNDHALIVPRSDKRARAYTFVCDTSVFGKVDVTLELSW